jgi:outer membrane protein, heavy metal efflux system
MRARAALFTILLLPIGCATRPPDAGFDDVRNVANQRSGHSVRWNQNTADDKAVATSLEAILAHELTIDQVVQIALLNNRNLQATFEELGIAQADLVQAGLLKNPVLDASIRFPDGGVGKNNIEFNVAENFIDLLMLPMRKRVAAANLELTKFRVENEVIDLASETESAFYSLQASQQLAELRHTAFEAAETSLNAAQRIHDAGNSTDLDLATEQVQHEQAKLDLAQQQSMTVLSRERLNVLMGLWGAQTQWTIASRLPDPPADGPAVDDLERFALSQRLDLAASRQQITVAAQSLGITKPFALISDAEIGIDTERDTDGRWVTGPNVSLPIPLFDQGQGRIAKLLAELRQAQDRYHAQTVEIRSQVRSTWSQMQTAYSRAEQIRTVILPLRQKIVEQMQLHYNGMLVGVFQLLTARQQQVEAGRAYVDALHEYWTARVNLTKQLGGRLP